MNLQQFTDSLAQETQPPGLSFQQQALWLGAKGDWFNAHECVRDLVDPFSAHIHAYLHRVEGVLWNADHWYKRAGKSRPDCSLKEEWQQLATQAALE